MAIYHLEAKIISRSTGRSAVAASAYMSCSKILNKYDGVPHDYTRKKGLVWEQIFLPENAPPEWQDRSKLWNAVERTEKTKDSRLAREFVVALPIELDRNQWINLLTDYIQGNFVADGMCADVAIHDTDGHNPHAHIMLTLRPLNDNGKWQNKTEKEYLCKRNGEEKGFTATEFLKAKSDGWEKQYQYYVGKKKVYMTPSEANYNGYERVNKYPKSTRYGRQNIITARWNSDEQLIIWRKSWAETVNQHLVICGHKNIQIDHRSNAERGIDEQPTIHEGITARMIEKAGFISDRCEINRQIKADNKLLKELKLAFQKISQTVKNTIPILAEAMEALREKLLIINYHIRQVQIGKRSVKDCFKSSSENLEKYKYVVTQISDKEKERNGLLSEKKATSVLKVIKYRELVQRITELTEDIEELQSEKARLLKDMECANDNDIPHVNKGLSKLKAALAELNKRETDYTAQLNEALQQYAEYKEQAKDFDPGELGNARLNLRSDKEQSARNYLKYAYGDQYDGIDFVSCRYEIDGKLDDEIDMQAVRNYNQQQYIKAHSQKSKNSRQTPHSR